MPIGGIIAEVIGTIIGEVLWEGLVLKVLWPVLRFPGALGVWLVQRDRPISAVWNKGDHFTQTMIGCFFWPGMVLILCVI